jgi:putative transposase
VTVLSHHVRLDLNNVQRTWFTRCAGAARFAFNWGLAEWQRQYDAGEKPSWQRLNAALNARKRADLAWLNELPWYVANNALSNLGEAFSGFFRRVKAGGKPGYPKFKKRGRTPPAFSVETRALTFDGRRLKLPKLGWVRLREPLRFPGKVLSARFGEHAGHWYVSVQVEIDTSCWSYPHRCETQAACGVDLGLVDLAVVSDGLRVAAPRALRRYERKLRQLNKALSRRAKGGSNWKSTKAKLGRLHERIANVRADATNKLTADLVERFRWIGIEDLAVRGMAKTRLAKSVMDAAMAEVRRQLEYKAPLAGSAVVVAGRWFPSSKRCSVCGGVLDVLPLSTRRWPCPSCAAEHDRDENAAENLKQLAAAHAATACCPGGADAGLATNVKPLAGQEPGSYVFT